MLRICIRIIFVYTHIFCHICVYKLHGIVTNSKRPLGMARTRLGRRHRLYRFYIYAT